MLRLLPRGRTDRSRVAVALAVMSAFVVTVGLSPSSVATDDPRDDLRHKENRLDNRIDARRGHLQEISTRLVNAQGRVDIAVADLDEARSELSRLREQVYQATLFDQEMQRRLEDAVIRLGNAREDLQQGRQDVVATRSRLASYAVSDSMTGGSDLMSLGVAFEADTTEEAINNMQVGETVLDKQAVALQELEATEVLLTLTEQRVEEAKAVVRDNRIAAAENLENKRILKGQAQTAKENVTNRLETLREVRQEIAEAKAEELENIQQMEREREAIESRLQEIAERRARKNRTTISQVPTSSESGGFMDYPVASTYITSPYGMRLHPILNYWKLHDGTDFSAACGTPVHAAADGRVSETYYDAGYGNRLIIDHGFARGASVWTSYNHMMGYSTYVGDRVQKGEVIGYVGTTGYSTGCHMHFMVYVNGTAKDPMNWL